MISNKKVSKEHNSKLYSLHKKASSISSGVKRTFDSSINVTETLNPQADFFFHHASQPYFILAANGSFISANKAGETFVGKTQDDLKFLNFKTFLSKTSKHLFDSTLSKALISNEKESFETIISISGNSIPVRVNITAFPQTMECMVEVADLTLEKRLQQAKAIEHSYQTLVDEASVGIFVADVNGNYSSVNKYGCEMLGYTLEELLTMNIKDVLVDTEIKQQPLQMQKMLSGYQVFSERNMVRKDGSLVPVEISGKVLSDGRLQGIVRNLTDRKLAEKALRESEANYKHAESIAHLGSWQMDIKTGKSKWSDEFFRICGYEPQAFEPTIFMRYQVVHPEDRELSEKAIQRAISEKSCYKLEKRVLRPNGEVRYVLSLGEIILDANNQPVELKGVFLDITELKKIELSLKKSEDKYRKLLEFLPIGVIIRNKKGELVFRNKKSYEILDVEDKVSTINHSKSFSIIRKDETIMPPEEFPGTRALNEERTIENVELGVLLENRNIWLNATASPMPGNEEAIIAFMDITDKVEREKQLNELSAKLQELNATKDKFFSIIAHDLKNPFNSILGFSELLVKNLETYTLAENKKFASIINETSKKTYNLLENLLLWARSQTGNMEYNPSLYSLGNLVMDTIDLISPMAIKKQIKINYQFSGDYRVMVDRNMMDTVFRNILTNAVKFSYPESEIDVTIDEKADNYVVSIKDSGIGIDADNLGKLFRLDSKFSVLGTMKEKGSGLGLLISKEFIERNKGKIQVSSEYGKGTEFSIILPKAE